MHQDIFESLLQYPAETAGNNLTFLPELICKLAEFVEVEDNKELSLLPSESENGLVAATKQTASFNGGSKSNISILSAISHLVYLNVNWKPFAGFVLNRLFKSWNLSVMLERGVSRELRDFVCSAYRLCRISAIEFGHYFPLDSIMHLIDFNLNRNVDSGMNTEDVEDDLTLITRYYAALVIALLTGMSDFEKEQLLENIFAANHQMIQAKSLYVQDMNALEESRKYLLNPTDTHPTVSFEPHQLEYTVNLCGVLVPHESLFIENATKKFDLNKSFSSSFVVTPTSHKILADIAMALACGLPILLQGKSGVGKTSVIEEAGRIVGSKELLKIHLGDQTDSKLLLGTYMTTSTPGEFRWQAGVLTTAVTEGRWIVFEDIDMAPVEVLAVLLPLLETRYLHIPSRGERIRAKEGFQIFATRKNGSVGDSSKIGSNLWALIDAPEMQYDELELVLSKRFPSIQSLLPGILSVYKITCHNFPVTNGRQVSIRDLIKWCERVASSSLASASFVTDSNETHELLFREAFDCVAAMIANEKDRLTLAKLVASAIGLSDHRVDYFLHHYIPTFTSSADADLSSFSGNAVLQCGRATLPIRLLLDPSVADRRSPFANTSASMRNLERIAVAVKQQEPILLVGETGTGKTTIVQQLATQLGHKLVVMNMSQQSDSTDLLGGFKPIDALMLASPLKEMFDRLFAATFSLSQNKAFLDTITKLFKKKKWEQLVVGFKNACQMARKVADNQRQAKKELLIASDGGINSKNSASIEKPKKLRKVLDSSLFTEWETFAVLVMQFKAQVHQIKTNFLFSFVEGGLIKALKNGDWILLDEINLANAETLECLSSLLQSPSGSILLLERGDTIPIQRHPNFRLFACMNPANDAGKRNLPSGLRSRFTEFWIDAPDSNLSDLMLIIKSYIHRFVPPGPTGEGMCMDVANFYNQTKEMARSHSLFDGADQRVHVSMRTLTRALSCAGHIAPTYGIRRSLYEGCFMTFMTGLGTASFKAVNELLYQHILHGIKRPGAFVNQVPQNPSAPATDSNLSYDEPYALIETYWLEKGNFAVPDDLDSTFVLTPSVLTNLRNLARGCLSRKYPILIQGPTSAGKTSIIEYLAKRTGHRFIRINNHEHTDLQEYLGGYVSNDNGSLVFQEGILVEALRKGYWVVLDELNLAPSDVLEALNRLLDDNRELYLAEKQEVVKPHPHFMLFATQNPAGQYGGRKQLSRAFRNRFLELHFSDIPENELETILEKRCLIAPSYAKKCVSVYKQLSKSRDASRIFDGKQSFITLRDLFRWALRRAESYEELAQDGYMLLAERVRKESDRATILTILQKELRVKLDIEGFYVTRFEKIFESMSTSWTSSIVWTSAMKKLFVLIYSAAVHYEPVLLIGETGCGKTTVCQVLALLFKQHLHMVNAHQNSETSDFLGSQRPVRGREESEKTLRQQFLGVASKFNLAVTADECLLGSLSSVEKSILLYLERERSSPSSPELLESLEALEGLLQRSKALFEWHDGPLVQAMQSGDLFLLDEISLADDSVLERLNSVLEPSRQLTLVEKNGGDVVEIKAADAFRFFATMNPGGDYGKKELSPALRNRFTEIWVSSVISRRQDLLLIISNRLSVFGEDVAISLAEKIMNFIDWVALAIHKAAADIVSLRDVLAWSDFISAAHEKLGPEQAYLHGGCMVLVDGIGINPLLGVTGAGSNQLSREAKGKLFELSGALQDTTQPGVIQSLEESQVFGSCPFYVPFGPIPRKSVKFSMDAPTTLQNAMRLLRAMTFSKKPLLLEGSPGAGKTSLITSIAAIGGYSLVRINLSEQTDLMDLFGSDLPVEGGNGGEFAWRDGPFLKAMQDGHWVLLDELNLASQQVLEGLNACLDHRATVFIPELDRHFPCHPDFRVFAAQNPQSQGGGRKGLPKSFVNRFTLVCVDELLLQDMQRICRSLYPQLEPDLMEKMITFNEQMKIHTMELRSFGWEGSPWEFNLRDLLRWIELTVNSKFPSHPSEFLDSLYLQRMRTRQDRQKVLELYNSIFSGEQAVYTNKVSGIQIYPNAVTIDSILQIRKNYRGRNVHSVPVNHLQLLPANLKIMHSLMLAVDSRSPLLLVGPSASGKTSLLRFYASLMGQRLDEFSMNPGVDALELLGGFEQVDLTRKQQDIVSLFGELVERELRHLFVGHNFIQAAQLNAVWKKFIDSSFFSSASFDAMFDVVRGFAIGSELENLQEKLVDFSNLQKTEARGKFEWLDSVLVTAIQQGHWMLIDNVNLCSSSVLDRLNSLLETNGTLSVNERGLINGEIKVITPHPNFRLFMAMDPKHGEVSRAMRNRAIEICMSEPLLSQQTSLVDIQRLLTAAGIPGMDASRRMKEKLQRDGSFSSTDMALLVERVYRGQSWASVFAMNSVESLCGISSWPDKVQGSDWVFTSGFAQSLYSSSFLHHQIDETPSYLSQGEITTLPSRDSMSFAAAKRFFKSASRVSRKELRAWIKFASRVFEAHLPEIELLRQMENVFFGEEESSRPLVSDINKKRVEILSLVSLVDYTDILPLDLRNSSIAFQNLEGYDDLLSLLNLWDLQMHGQYRQALFSDHIENCLASPMSSLTLIQLSFWVHKKKTRVSNLPHPAIKYFYLFFEQAIDFMVFFKEDYEFGCAFLHLLEDFWQLAAAQVFDNTKVLVIVNRLIKITEKFCGIAPQGLLSCLNDLATCLEIARFRSCSALWKKSDVLTLTSLDLFSLSRQFTERDKAMEVWAMNPKDWFLPRKEELRTMLIEGVSTLYFLNSQKDRDFGLFSAITKLIEVFPSPQRNDADVDTLELRSLKVVDEAQAQADKFLFWPVIDLKCLTIGMRFAKLLCNPMNQKDIVLAREFLASHSSHSSFTPLHFEPFQRLVWNAESDTKEGSVGFKSAVREYLLNWFRGVWKNGFTFWTANLYNDEISGIFDGAFAPLLFDEIPPLKDLHGDSCAIPMISASSTIILWMTRLMDHVPLYCVPSKLNQLQSIQLNCSKAPILLKDIYGDDDDMFSISLFRFLACYCKSLQLKQLQDLTLRSLPSLLTLVTEWIPVFLYGMVKTVLENLARFRDQKLFQSSPTQESSRGHLWISFSCLSLRALIPDFEMDPVDVRKAKQTFLSKKIDSGEADLLVEMEYQLLTTGNDNCKEKDEKRKLLQRYMQRDEKLNHMQPLRPDVPQLPEMLTELKNLKNQIVSEHGITSLCQSIALQSTDWKDQEKSMQLVLAVVADRLEKKYFMYRDLIDPVIAAIFQLKYGLRLLANGSQRVKAAPLSSIIANLVDFTCCDLDSIKTAANLCHGNSSIDGLTKMKVYLGFQRKLSVLLGSSLLADRKAIFDCSAELYFAIVELWSAVEKEKAAKAEESQSMYKVKTHIIKTMEEEEQEEFLDLFPDFSADDADLEVVDDSNGGVTDVGITSNARLSAELDSDLPNAITSSFKDTCLLASDTKSHSLGERWKVAYEDCFNVVADLSRSQKLLLDRSIDETGHLGFLFMSSFRVSQIESTAVYQGYDFYNDSNISEVQLIRPLLIRFSEAVHKPLAKWPEHDVLLNLDTVCRRLLSFSATSPIIRYLTGLELLLIKSDDWEKYTSKEFSLKSILNDMVVLIVKWRKLELESWRNLLDVETRKSKRKVSSQWFHLYKILVGTFFTDNEDERNQEFWKGILDLLNQFCLSSTLGEFEERLLVLKCFRRFLEQFGNAGKTQTTVLRLVSNVELFFRQFFLSVTTKLESLKQPILKELREYVQIASWKDVNVFALKESAKRTHHHLNKIVKKFRAVLAMPVKDVMAQYHEVASLTSPKSGKDSDFQTTLDRIFVHQFVSNVPFPLMSLDSVGTSSGRLQQSASLYGKAQKFALDSVSSTAVFDAAASIEALSEEVISRITDFQSQTFSSESEKSLKGQKMIRKKAWVDLLKHLVFIGLSPRSSQKFMLQQDVVYMNSLPVPSLKSLYCVGVTLPYCLELLERGEEYHYKNAARLELVRKLTSSPSRDISSLELEKAISFMDHMMRMSIVHRTAISNSASVLIPRFDALLKQIYDYTVSSKLPSDSLLGGGHRDRFIICLKSLNAIHLCFAQTRLILDSSVVSFDKVFFSLLQDFETGIKNRMESLALIEEESHSACRSFLLFSSKVDEMVMESMNFISSLENFLTDQSASSNSFLLKDLLFVVKNGTASFSRHLGVGQPSVSSAKCDVDQLGADCLEKALIAFQVLHRSCEGLKCEGVAGLDAEDSGREVDYKLLINAHEAVSEVWGPQHRRSFTELMETIEKLIQLTTQVGKEAQEGCLAVFQLLYPVLKQVYLLSQFRLLELALVHKSTSKLAHILSNTFYTVIKDGFCVPELSDDQEEDDGLQDDIDGMGIGEGDGKKDVSDEIENEDQVEGLQNEQEKAPDPNSSLKDEENGIEMENDFDGALEEVEPEENEAGASDDEGQDEQELEEQMGGLDDSADVVDEKMWGDDEEPPSNDGKDEKTEKDAPVKDGGETETVAKTGEEEEEKKEDASTPSKEKEKEKKSAENEDEDDKFPDDQINEDQPENYEESHGVDVKQADDLGYNDLEQPDEMKDLPDDLNLDGGEEDDKANDDQNEQFPPENEDYDSAADQPPESMPADADQEGEEAEGNDDLEDGLKEMDIDLDNENNAGEEEADEEKEAEQEEEDAAADQNTANGFNEDQQQPDVPEEEDLEENAKSQANQNDSHADQSTQPFGVEGDGDQIIQNQSDFLNQAGDSSAAMPDQQEMQNQSGTDQAKSSVEDSKSAPTPSANDQPNPHRSVGNAIEKWLSRLRSISDRIDDDSAVKPEESSKLDDEEGEKDFEFVQDDDEDQGNAQALGVANEDQLVNFDKAAGEEEEVMDNLEGEEEEKEMDVDGPDPESSAKILQDPQDKQEQSQQPHNSEKKEMKTKSVEKGEENGETGREEEQGEDDVMEDMEKGQETEEDDMEPKQFIRNLHTAEEDENGGDSSPMEVDEVAEQDLVDYDQMRVELETRMAQWRLETAGGGDHHQRSLNNMELWRKYSNLTRDFSFHLCEQLRLILEPTLSTKLKGDYRTGKRLNMRKIIPYIASQFKKDKIWLRRTKPSKRTYQIMLAIDDSMSMSNSHSVQLAFESLTLISNALHQLEVGEIGVISFGSTVKLLHPFEKAWSDEAGASVLSLFTFAQESTGVKLLMDQSINVLNHSRALQQNTDLWQLQIIISDGICEDHEYIRSRVRSAAEDQIAMVFIVLDTRSEKDSISNMNSVSYNVDPATGAPALKMTKYMDSFPFDFYVIVKNVELLPESDRGMQVVKAAIWLWLWLGIANAQSTHDFQTSSSTPTSSSSTTTFSPLIGSPTPFPPGKCFKSNRPKPSPSPSVPAQSPAPKQQSLQKPQQQQQQSRSSSAQAMVGDADGCIALQNKARAEVGVPPMVWDRQLAASAQAWANHLYTYDLGMVHSSGQGQNLYKGTGECQGANIAWVVKEKPRYLPGAPIDKWGDFESYGHFTQIVFRSTNRAGCSIPHANGGYFVCHYLGQQISGSPAY